MVWLIGFGVSVCKILSVEILEKLLGQQKYPNTVFSKLKRILLMVAQNPIICNIFWINKIR